jgi:hypothetical protein
MITDYFLRSLRREGREANPLGLVLQGSTGGTLKYYAAFL